MTPALVHIFRLPLLALLIGLAACLSVPYSSRIDNENWQVAVRKGTILYQQLQSACFPDVENPVTVADLIARGWALDGSGGSKWPPMVDTFDGFSHFVMKTMGWTETSDYYAKALRHGNSKAWQDFTNYSNIYSPRNRLIAAIATNRLPTEPIHWSDATFAMWAAITSLSRTNIQDLRYLGRSSVNNPFTTSILKRAVPDKSKGVSTFRAGEKAFLALLGTPNGVGVVHLLMQHKRALGWKNIVRVVVIRDGPWEWPHVIFEVGDVRLTGRDTGGVGMNRSWSLVLDGVGDMCRELNGTVNAELVANE